MSQAHLRAIPAHDDNDLDDDLKLGFACMWDNPPERTWSHVPWNLRNALRERTDLLDLGFQLSPVVRNALRMQGLRRRHGAWAAGPATLALLRHLPRRAERKLNPDVVLQIADLTTFRSPYLLFQDLSFDLLLDHFADIPGPIPHFTGLTRERVRFLAKRQRKIYASAAGVIATSRWFADHLVNSTGLDQSIVHVVPFGINANTPIGSGSPDERPAASHARTAADRAERPRLLFVASDFERKGGDQLVTAFTLLRAREFPGATLTIVGPRSLPMPGSVPDGVACLGRVTLDRLSQLYAEHDLYVMPSNFEAFGISFVDALSSGLPCVGRNICAMPDVIRHGDNGYLVDSQDPEDLRDVLVTALSDHGMWNRVADQAEAVRAHYNWGSSADRIISIARSVRQRS